MNTSRGDLECMLFDKKEEPKALPLSLLDEITNGFSDELIIGKGGFAVVYKGNLYNEYIAVKKLTNTYMYEKEFQQEVECLINAKHKNIIRFLGYCSDTQGNIARCDKRLVMADTQQRILCFEYLPNGSLDSYIKDASGGLVWTKRYRIIRGICEGLLHLHEMNILHLDLKPANILLDNEMTPKISDFGLSQLFEEGQVEVKAETVGGTLGYLAPEFTSKVITNKYDLYSLGVIILEILTGKKWSETTIEDVLPSCTNMLKILPGNEEWDKIRVCAEIGIECTNFDPKKRPISMKHIMDRLTEAESTEVIELLHIHTLVLRFPFEPNKVIMCSLDLTNNMNEPVVFKLMDKSNNSGACFLRLPLYGLVPPRSTYTLIVTTEQSNEQEMRNMGMILKSTILGEGQHTHTFESMHEDTFFANVKKMGNEVQEVKLIGVNTPRQAIMSPKPISPGFNILDMDKSYKRNMYSLDINQANQWIIIGGSEGYVGIWNYQRQKEVDSLKLSHQRDITCVKFIARKQWFVAATVYGDVHVYKYGSKMQKIKSLRLGGYYSLAVHPTRSYLLTWSHGVIELWDWDKGWECKEIYSSNVWWEIYQVTFTSKDIFAFATESHTLEVRSIDFVDYKYTLFGHSHKVSFLDYFTCGDQEYLFSASDDHTAKIWDMELMVCVCTLEHFSSLVISIVYQPDLQILINGTKDGSIYLWRTAESRVSPRSPRIINIGYGGALHSLACLIGGRVVIGKQDRVAILDIENKNYQEESTDYSETMYLRQGDIPSKVILGSSKLLDVHPLELRSHRQPHHMCSLHLTNNTNEHVAFRITSKEPTLYWIHQCFIKLPISGIVAPRSTCRLIIAMECEADQITEIDLVLHSRISGDKNLVLLTEMDWHNKFFNKDSELGHVVHELALKFVYDPTERETTFEPVNPPRMKIIPLMICRDLVHSLDAHPTEPWIITACSTGNIRIWNYDSQELVHTLKESEEIAFIVKFIASKQWIVALTINSSIRVYDCAHVTRISKIASFGAAEFSMAIHPTKPYVLSSSMSSTALWDGDKGWLYTRTFVGNRPCLTFNPEDPNSFAAVVPPWTIEVWSLDSTERDCALTGHTEPVTCLAYFTNGDRQYLISGSLDCTAMIWDLHKKASIHTLEGFMCPITQVYSLPGRPYLITVSNNSCTIHVWSSTDFRLRTTVNFSGCGIIHGIACLMGSRRIAIAHPFSISIMDIDDEEAVASEGHHQGSVCATDKFEKAMELAENPSSVSELNEQVDGMKRQLTAKEQKCISAIEAAKAAEKEISRLTQLMASKDEEYASLVEAAKAASDSEILRLTEELTAKSTVLDTVVDLLQTKEKEKDTMVDQFTQKQAKDEEQIKTLRKELDSLDEALNTEIFEPAGLDDNQSSTPCATRVIKAGQLLKKLIGAAKVVHPTLCPGQDLPLDNFILADRLTNAPLDIKE